MNTFEKICDELNKNNNRVDRKIQDETDIMFWNGKEWMVVYNYNK